MVNKDKINNALHISTIKDLLGLIARCYNRNRAKEIIEELEYIRDESPVNNLEFDTVIDEIREENQLCPKCHNLLKTEFYQESHGEQMANFQCYSCGWNDKLD